MKYQNRLIAHVLLTTAQGILVLKRSQEKNGRPTSFANFWDLPGGKVKDGELPQVAVVRECREELNEAVVLTGVIYESSQKNAANHTITTRLFYRGRLVKDVSLAEIDARLNPNEHTKAAYFNDFATWDKTEKFVPVLQNFLTSAAGKNFVAKNK